MKGICHTWSWGRHFSPSLPVSLFEGQQFSETQFYQNAISGPKSRGTSVRYDALAPRREALFSIRPFNSWVREGACERCITQVH